MVQVAKNEASKGFDTFWPVLYLLFKFTNLKISRLLTLMIWNIYCQNSGRTWNVFSNLKPQPWTSTCLAKVVAGKESVKLPCLTLLKVNKKISNLNQPTKTWSVSSGQKPQHQHPWMDTVTGLQLMYNRKFVPTFCSSICQRHCLPIVRQHLIEIEGHNIARESTRHDCHDWSLAKAFWREKKHSQVDTSKAVMAWDIT